MLSKLTNRVYRNFSTLQNITSGTGAVTKREYLQFSKARLTDFGELSQGFIYYYILNISLGEIPDELHYDLPAGNKILLLTNINFQK